ncbi:MAG TPA: hypothetical protein VGP99_03000, partial [Tepidisphaeraceae bacterium]|nr:hypothetical protein [Tepidisphaeraceae bacterium]
MNQFREQLHAARLSYHAPVYSDDLASQIIPPRRSIWPRIVGTVLAGAAAASIVIVLLNQTIVPPQPQRIEKVAARQHSPEFAILPGLPQIPQTSPLAPTLGDQPVFLPSLPILPS